MQQQPTTEQRLAILEGRVTDLERERERQADRDIALLARIDSFIDDMRRVERVQIRMFDELSAGQKTIETAIKAIPETLQDHKAHIEALGGRINGLEAGQEHIEAGLQQVILLLTGKAPRND